MTEPTSQPAAGPVWAAVPFKGPVGSKQRLAGLLDADERASLSLAMLDGVLDALLATPAIERVLLLRPAGAPPTARRDDRLMVISEDAVLDAQQATSRLNAVLRQAQVTAEAGGAGSLLILPSDLPLISAADIQALLLAAEAQIVVQPDRVRDGTNALLLRPPGALPPSFGQASFERHRDLARRGGFNVTVAERPGLALDLDTPADVAALLASVLASGQVGPAARLLRDLGVARRLEQLGLAQARSATI